MRAAAAATGGNTHYRRPDQPAVISPADIGSAHGIVWLRYLSFVATPAQ
jgi:hypothetical protein